MKENNLENLVLDYGTYVDISAELLRDQRDEFFKKYNLNYNHYRDGSYGYYNDTIGWCHRYHLCKTHNGELLSTVLTNLMQEFTNEFNKVYPDIACYIYYDSMFDYIKEASNYYHGGYHTPDEFKKYFKGYYKQFGSYRFAMKIENKNIDIIKKAIKMIKKLNPTKISPEIGKTYITTEDCDIGTRFRLREDTKFELIKEGSSWNNHKVIKILDGKVATTVHSSFFNTDEIKLNSVNGNKDKFYSLDEFKTTFGIELDKLTISYDPFGSAEYLPCTEL